MITSIVGRLIKKPELIDRVQIPGKRIVLFTLVQHNNRGDRRLSVFYNLSMLVGTDAQYEMVMRFEKNTVLLFSFPRITYVKQAEKSADEQVINLYADVENFKIVAGAEAAFSSSMSDSVGEAPFPASLAEEAAPIAAPIAASMPEGAAPRPSMPNSAPSARPSAAPSSRPAPRDHDETPDFGELSDLDDPFSSGASVSAARAGRPAPVPAASGASGQRRPSNGAASSRPMSASSAPSPAKSRRPVPSTDEDLSEMSDPFAESEL